MTFAQISLDWRREAAQKVLQACSGAWRSAERVLRGSLQENGIGLAPMWGSDQVRLELIEFKSLIGLSLPECYHADFSVG